MKKYKLTDETKVHELRTLHRIQALRAIQGRTYPGEFGGWVESEENLSHDGGCWVSGEAMVYGDATVMDDAYISENAQVYCAAIVCGNAHIVEYASVGGTATVMDDARICGHAQVTCAAEVHNIANVGGYAHVTGRAIITERARIQGYAKVSEFAYVHSGATVRGSAEVFGHAVVGNCVFLNEATWEENPLYIQGTKYPMFSPDKKSLTIGCQCHTFEYWRKRWKTIARLCNEGNKDILEECRLAFNLFVTRYGDGITIDRL